MMNFDQKAESDYAAATARDGVSDAGDFYEPGFLEVHDAFVKYSMNEARSDSELMLMEDPVNDALDAYRRIDQKFNQSYRARRFSRGFGYAQRKKLLIDIEDRILEAQKNNPDAGLLTFNEILNQTQEKTTADREQAMRAFANARGFAKGGMLTGTMRGVITDPLILATLPLGAGTITGASVAGNAWKAFKLEAIIAAAAEIPIQAQVINWKKDINSPYSTQEAAFNVLTAMAAAGTLRATGSTIMDVVQIRTAAKAKRAEGGKLADQEADILEQYADDLEAGGDNVTEHFDNLDTVLDDLDRGETSTVSGRSEHVEEVDPFGIDVDANRFQFKAGADELGVTERLQGVQRWDPKLAGIAIVYETHTGRQFIVDGHQRVSLARRMVDAGQDPAEVKLNAIVLREADGVTDADARQIAAVKNIAEGTGSAVDTAKVFREFGESGLDLMPSLPPKSALVVAGRGLSNLDDEAFKMVINGVVDEKVGAIVGELITDAAEQRAVITALAQAEPANLTQARIMINDMKAAGFQRTETEDLFGGMEIAESLFKERARILDNAMKRLRQDKATFATLERKAGEIEAEGNILDQQANLARKVSDEQTLAELTRLANTKGPISDALNQAAKELKEGKTISQSTTDFLDAARRPEPEQRAAGAGAGGAGPAEQIIEFKKGQPVNLDEIPIAQKSAVQDDFISKQAGITLDELYKGASARQGQLTKAANSIVKELGDENAAYITPGVKTRARTEEKLQGKYNGNIGKLTDINRGGFIARTPEEGEKIAGLLGNKFEVMDENWNITDAGYYDRKVLVRFKDGKVGEIQIWEPHIFLAKEDGDGLKSIPEKWIDPAQTVPSKEQSGHGIYERMRVLMVDGKIPAEKMDEFKALEAESVRLYADANRLANNSWKTLIETRRPESLISTGEALDQLPGSASGKITKPARPSDSTTTAGILSQSYQPETSDLSKGISTTEIIANRDIVVKTETGMDPAPQPGEPFLVMRLGNESELTNVNAGNSRAVAHHILRQQDIESPAVRDPGNTVSVFRVVVDEDFGESVRYNKGRTEKVSTKVGRGVQGEEVSYSFPEAARTKFKAEKVAEIPLDEAHARLNAEDATIENFDDAGIIMGARILDDLAGEKIARAPIEQARKTTEPVLDLFGEDTRGAQAIHNARLDIERELNPDNVVPVEAGPGDLFSGKSRQVDIEDEVDRLIYEHDLDVPEGILVDADGNLTASARSAREVYDEIDETAKALDELEGCHLGKVA